MPRSIAFVHVQLRCIVGLKLVGHPREAATAGGFEAVADDPPCTQSCLGTTVN
jgi:hypothetical protein